MIGEIKITMDKIKTAEETLSEITGEEGLYITHGMVRGSEALEAMDIYATQQSRIDAIGFAEWINKNYWWQDDVFNWLVSENDSIPAHSSDQLYELYLQSIK